MKMKIRNGLDRKPNKVDLILESDLSYQEYISRFKTRKEPDVVYNKPVPEKAQTMGYLLELSTKVWVKNSGKMLDENIIRAEYFKKNGSTINYKEVDLLIRNDANLIIGEVKVSSNEKGLVSQAGNQLLASKKLLEHKFRNITLLIIRIDLSYKYNEGLLSEFEDDFSRVKLQDFVWNDHKFKLLHLSAKDVFNYGVKMKVIRSPELWSPLEKEMDLVHELRELKAIRKASKRELADTTTTSSDLQKKQDLDIEDRFRLLETEVGISKCGYSLYSRDEDHSLSAEEVLYKFGNIEPMTNIDNSHTSNSGGFLNLNPSYKFLAFYSESDNFKIDLLDADRVYLRIPVDRCDKLQSIRFKSCVDSGAAFHSYPLLDKKPYRKYFYNGLPEYVSDDNVELLKEFENVIRKSEPISCAVQRKEILIIDNPRMLFRLNDHDEAIIQIFAIRNDSYIGN